MLSFFLDFILSIFYAKLIKKNITAKNIIKLILHDIKNKVEEGIKCLISFVFVQEMCIFV